MSLKKHETFHLPHLSKPICTWHCHFSKPAAACSNKTQKQLTKWLVVRKKLKHSNSCKINHCSYIWKKLILAIQTLLTIIRRVKHLTGQMKVCWICIRVRKTLVYLAISSRFWFSTFQEMYVFHPTATVLTNNTLPKKINNRIIHTKNNKINTCITRKWS